MLSNIIKNEKWFRVLQWTWGFPQTFCGAALYLHYRNAPHTEYHGASVTLWPHESSVSLGMFLFLTNQVSDIKKGNSLDNKAAQKLLMHEYGHAIQSLICGPLYLAVVGLPSFLWNRLPIAEQRRSRKRISYYDVYPEKHANRLGEHYLKKNN